MDKKQDLETEEMWSDIDSVESKITPRLRAEEVGIIWHLMAWEDWSWVFWEVEQEDQWGETQLWTDLVTTEWKTSTER